MLTKAVCLWLGLKEDHNTFLQHEMSPGNGLISWKKKYK